MDPGIRRCKRSAAVGGRDRLRRSVDEGRIERTGFGQMIEGLAFVEAGHFNCEFDRRTWPVDLERSIVALRVRDDAAIDLGGEPAVDFDLFVAGGFPLLE